MSYRAVLSVIAHILEFAEIRSLDVIKLKTPLSWKGFTKSYLLI